MPAGSAARGLFITLEGPDGSGKSTQFRMLADRLRREGHAVLESVEPGGTPIGQEIRRILLDPANQELTAVAELLLMFACRAQNVEEWILPALAEGKIVVSDRFTDSSIAYQGAGRGLGWDTVLEIDRIACHGLIPDLTLCIDIDTETGLARAHSRNRENTGQSEARIDQQAVEFHHRVREAYHELARREPKRFRLIDGHGSPEEIADNVWAEVTGAIAKKRANPDTLVETN
ncbi:MAG TPA: dTMP kinase [Bryobacteraceae bacterium]|nr:dTMP kinase [Bryobacteraceae bacterium]